MQFHLSRDELNLLADILQERVGMMSAQKPSAASVQGNGDVGRAARHYDDLLDKTLAKDLRLDLGELEQVADLLNEQKCGLKDEIARLQHSVLRINLQLKLGLLERILQRVEEACATL
jgi:hypothetical protein